MLSKQMMAAALASTMALVPAAPVAADGKEFIAGALIGGLVGAKLQQNADRNRAARAAPAPRVVQKSVAPVRQRSFAAPTIPATQTGRDIQASLNYFGFNAGSVDGRIGRNTRAAIAEYQAYMGYPATGTLNGFEQELLLRSYTRAQIGGEDTFRRLAASPDGTRGLLRQYRADFASGAVQPQAGSIGFQGYAATN